VKVALATLGCKLNLADSDDLAAQLAAAGHEIVGYGPGADAYVVNSCTVTAEADHKCRQLIHRALRGTPESPVFVVGCGARVHAKLIEDLNLERVRAIPSNAELVRLLGTGGERRPAPRRHTREFIKVQEGCDTGCAYCIVPAARGVPTSVQPELIVKRVEAAAEAGVPEVVLTGTSIGRYGDDLPTSIDLNALVRRLHGIGPRLRLSSVEPMDLGDGIVELLVEGLICKHLHVPLESGDDRILAAMGRPYTVSEYTALLKRLRAASEGVAITTDVMVGFPGEDESAFGHTEHFCRRARFARIHVFRYSPRPGTAAAELPDDVTPEIKRIRAAKLRGLGEELAMAHVCSLVDRPVEVVVERHIEHNRSVGTSGEYARVVLPKIFPIGSLVTARGTRATGGYLFAEPTHG
jgi:threonylcarbamoyladenosine tRNA methylthiotransferase MtaB